MLLQQRGEEFDNKEQPLREEWKDPAPLQGIIFALAKWLHTLCCSSFTLSGTSLCSLPLMVGSCTAPTNRFYYDASSATCKRFTYSGCGGNANNFQSFASCQATCGSSGIAFCVIFICTFV
ncbi:unnamed protein product [Nippostrongylus brasiliensis]|uniref:BPTI/Kunitz inhibitor domain-containing protein n=1 Tax=Nippostrongylus brasiliensis TaxID=27835 RepID=A0A0N4XYN2_NIPBR|nr:unnamed protein product [Nippostrongylus brasiliensis]